MVFRLLRMTVIGFGILLSLLAVLADGSIVGARRIAQAHPPAGRFVEVGGGRLHVVDIDERVQPSDDDPPVVLLHGASGNLEDMRLALADRLTEYGDPPREPLVDGQERLERRADQRRDS